MKIVVFGANGLLGRATAAALAARGHEVVRACRRGGDVAVDFRFDSSADILRTIVRGADIVVNTAGILIERDGDTWDAVHVKAVEALAAACEHERVARIVHVSALGVGSGIGGGYMASKLAGEQALAAHGVDYAIVRPALLVTSESPSTLLFAALARLPVIALPGLAHPGASGLAPIHAADVAQCIARIVEHPKALRRVIELEGPERMTYRGMLARLREVQGKGGGLWLPVPWFAMYAGAWVARFVPQKVFSPDTMRMLQAEPRAAANETARWLRREALPLEAALEPAPRPGPASPRAVQGPVA